MMLMMRQGSRGGGQGGEQAAASPSGGGMEVGTRRCEDCGNQAKKECKYKRCRRCCKRKGFRCKTHVTSTWVPASCRRTTSTITPLSLHTTTTLPLPQHQHPHAPAGLSSSFPAEVKAMAIFRCCRVSSVMGGDHDHQYMNSSVPGDDDQEYYAYQTAVSIGGHVFKGILYDQGRHQGETSSSSSTTPLLLQAMQPQQRQRPGGGHIAPPTSSSSYPSFSLTTTASTAAAAAAASTSGTKHFWLHPMDIMYSGGFN